ncbi:hypothetical protein Tsubulata_035038 [Turnera subulata]|uniref:Fibronectin type III-like domain-containing protein n=1 Tax=Turnera subulata TaxID=218843 RepID=A0A9Q0FWF3_9ROSI|nr:hypothetical protein Tsubulata_035038 [Turnera subulata]
MAKSHTFLIFTNFLIAYLFILGCARDVPTNSYNTLGHGDATPIGSNFTFLCDPKRASDLVKQMTLSEKVLQLGNTNRGVPRLGLPKYEWWSEALHGVSNVGPGTFFDDLVPSSTSFPTVITSAASFNESLWKTIGQAVSTEARAMYNLGRAGLTYWSPNINVDVEGTEDFKDLNSRPLKVSSCCKHYAAYDVDNWKSIVRESYDARVAEQDMVETFLRPFEMCIKEGDVSSIMCSYNRVNGIPTCADPKLLNQTIRRDWDLHGPQYTSLGKKDICSDEHVELAREAAREGTVLLKNIDQTLPLDANNFKTLAVIGPHANATAAMIGNYAGVPCKIVTPLDALSAYGEVDYKVGCGEMKCRNDSLIFPAMQAAEKADATIIVAGIDLSIEAERGLDISFAKANKKIGAILWVGYPGEKGGLAIADVIFGKYNPGGRLHMLPMTSMPLRPVDSLGYPGRTYKFFNGSTVFPFAYGLSYTKLNYTLKSAMRSTHIKLNKFQHCYGIKYRKESHIPHCPSVRIDDMDCKEKINFQVEVKNAGDRDGSEVVVVYSKPLEGIEATHIKQVIGFQRVFVPAGGSKKVKFVLNVCNSLRVVDYNAYSVLPSGGHTIIIGDDIISFPVHVNFSS